MKDIELTQRGVIDEYEQHVIRLKEEVIINTIQSESLNIEIEN